MDLVVTEFVEALRKLSPLQIKKKYYIFQM